MSAEARTLALAGLHQACWLVRQVARHGPSRDADLEHSLASVLRIDAPDAAAVYGGIAGVRTGLQVLVRQFGSDTRPGDRDLELARYGLTLLHLERKLARRPELLQKLRHGIEAAADQARYFSPTHANVIARLGQLYQDTVSTLTPRVMVTGNALVLGNPDNAALIRALLLAGMRSAVLWHQSGGRRLQLLFQRTRIVRTARSLLERLEGEPPAADT